MERRAAIDSLGYQVEDSFSVGRSNIVRRGRNIDPSGVSVAILAQALQPTWLAHTRSPLWCVELVACLGFDASWPSVRHGLLLASRRALRSRI